MKTTTTLFATTLLTLSLAPALQAQGQGYPDQPQDRYQPRDQNQYQGPDRDRAIYPDAGHLDRVSALAHEIDQTASWTYREFTRNNRRPNRDEYRAMGTLRDLNVAAARFHDEVEGYRRDPRHTADDFARLERSFYTAGHALRRIQPRPYVDRGMQKIYDQMSELSAFYGRHAGAYGHWGDRDHGDDHDRYDRNPTDRGPAPDHDHDNGYRPPFRF
jgi:hypothetical protein